MDPTGGTEERHFSGTMTRVLLEHVRRCRGDAGVAEVLARSGDQQPLGALMDDASGSSYPAFRRLLESAVVVLGSLELLRDVGRSAALDAGSMPGATEAILAIGSPAALLSELNHGNTGLSTVERGGFTEQVGSAEWILARRLDAGFEPFPELCAFQTGMASMIPRMFGFDVLEAEEISCQRHGEPWCRIRLAWEETDSERHRADFLATRLALAERRMEHFQRTVADLVSTDELEPLLEKLVAATAGAVRASAYVLALDVLPWSGTLVYAFGIADDAAAEVVSAVRAGQGDAHVVVDVASARRHHGLLIAVDATELLPPSMYQLFESYARLAATALDAAIAVEEARRQAATATLLLELASRLASVDSLPALASTLAELVPGVLECDRAVVAVIDDDQRRARPLAVSGYPPELERLMLATPIRLPEPLGTGISYYDRTDVAPDQRAMMEATGSIRCVMVPIVVDAEVLGWIAGDVTQDRGRLEPSRQLEERLHGVSAQASTALHNSLLLERVRHQAHHDGLTGLANRAVLVETLDSVLAFGAAPAVLFVDLDDFKHVNDGLGHQAGDELLRAVSARLVASVRAEDLVARLGGDEFAVLLVNPDPGSALRVARGLIERLQQPFALEDGQVTIGASVGVASGRDVPSDQLLRNADIAMYRAKAAGKGRLALFEPGMDHAASERLSLHADLQEGIGRGELRLHYQPVFDLGTGDMRACEALVRWEHPRLGLLRPDQFIELAETTGLIVPLGVWVLQEACAEASTWPDHVAIAVNLSPRQLDDAGVVADVQRILAGTGLDARRLILEITENALADDEARMCERLEAIRSLGVRIAIDDFGTGYSTLSALMQMPVDVLKIDRSFVCSMLDHPGAAALVQALIDIGRSLGLEVIAEGIENPEQARMLAERACQQGQGFLYSRPVPAEELEPFLTPVGTGGPDTVTRDGPGRAA